MDNSESCQSFKANIEQCLWKDISKIGKQSSWMPEQLEGISRQESSQKGKAECASEQTDYFTILSRTLLPGHTASVLPRLAPAALLCVCFVLFCSLN